MLTCLQVGPEEPPLSPLPHGKPAHCYCLEKEAKPLADRMKILEMLKDFPVSSLLAHMLF